MSTSNRFLTADFFHKGVMEVLGLDHLSVAAFNIDVQPESPVRVTVGFYLTEDQMNRIIALKYKEIDESEKEKIEGDSISDIARSLIKAYEQKEAPV